jgi:hypothetical protein
MEHLHGLAVPLSDSLEQAARLRRVWFHLKHGPAPLMYNPTFPSECDNSLRIFVAENEQRPMSQSYRVVASGREHLHAGAGIPANSRGDDGDNDQQLDQVKALLRRLPCCTSMRDIAIILLGELVSCHLSAMPVDSASGALPRFSPFHPGWPKRSICRRG